jgi:hypothetical protein
MVQAEKSATVFAARDQQILHVQTEAKATRMAQAWKRRHQRSADKRHGPVSLLSETP